MSYTIGCIGNVDPKRPSYSGSFLISGEKCFRLSNGVSLFKEGKTGLFTNYCEVIPDTNRIDQYQYFVYAYPNPVISVVTIQALRRIAAIEEIQLSIYNSAGSKVLQMKTNSKLINEGIKIKMNGLKKGIYFITLRSPKASADLKLIKLD